MKKIINLFAMFAICMNCLADEFSVLTELKALYNAQKEYTKQSITKQSITLEEIKMYQDKFATNQPIINREFAKLAAGEITPLTRELLQTPEAMDFCWNILRKQFKNYDTETQTIAFNTLFNNILDIMRGRLIKSFVLHSPKEVFGGPEIQKWLVEKINKGLPAGPFYFILTDESAEAVLETARADMKQYPNPKGGNTFILLSAAFLASRGDEDALNLLESLIDQRNFDSIFNAEYGIHAAAMSGNEKLIQQIREIITTDKRSRYNGGAYPPETSFAQIAASACSFIIEGFPYVYLWNPYDEDLQKEVHDWLEANPTHTIKPDSARRFLQLDAPFTTIMSNMLRSGWGWNE